MRFEDLENRVAEELKVFACAINKGFQKMNKCVIFFFLQAPIFDDLKVAKFNGDTGTLN